MVAKTGTKAVLYGTLALATGATCLRTSFSVRELSNIAAREASIEAEYASALTARQAAVAADTNPSLLYPAYNLSVPIDHFHNDTLYEPHTNDTFNLRYWFDASHYQPGGPVIVLQSGETSGVGRLPFLQKGIVSILSQATGGLGVILEHRYYGTSFPVSDLSIESLRFLTTDQALADMAYFAQNVKFPGLEDVDLTSASAPYIAYGGSYAGGFVAFLRKLYPDVYWGAISSSGVTEAMYDYWAYYEAARIYAPGDCATATQKLTNVVDNILIGKSGTEWVQRLKDVFGLGNVTRDNDFARALSFGIAGLQDTNWDPAINDTSFGVYCDTMSSDAIIYNDTVARKAEAVEVLKAGGYEDEVDTLTNRFLNYIGHVNSTVVAVCAHYEVTQDDCLTNYAPEYYALDDIEQTWRAWPWQYCSEWGYLLTGSGVPEDQLPLISRLIDIDYSSVICKEAFNITTPAQTERINQWGGFNISYPRLAIVNGEKDPWRQATPNAIGLPDRVSTTSEPFFLIEDGVHHWDENGLFPNQTTAELPPAPVKEAQAQEVEFVKAWLEEWKQAKGTIG
ncbi:serine carboxypeptidase [Diaporthe helianthi]|uniref:Serine carboxypeptidase n=1 Tax=Diaporthe helianthi TaxID=158607 RepID=A0A2P5HY46_DIAHE|nr:serine carboxypeptidase [Diaporthe helianthi]